METTGKGTTNNQFPFNMIKEGKEKQTKKTKSTNTGKKGSNWKSMKGMILRNPVESRKKYVIQHTIKNRSARERNPEKSVSTKTKSSLEDMLNPDGMGTRSLTPVIAIDCEMVGVGNKGDSALARVSVVNSYGAVIIANPNDE